MSAGARVVREPREGQLLGTGVAAHRRSRLEHRDLEPGDREVPGAYQGIVTRADHHDVTDLAGRQPDLLRRTPNHQRANDVTIVQAFAPVAPTVAYRFLSCHDALTDRGAGHDTAA